MLINKKAVKTYVLEVLALTRPHLKDKLTRVSSDVYDFLEASLRTDIQHFVASHPSTGKTLTTGTRKAEEVDY